jgi:hypothetical protein
LSPKRSNPDPGRLLPGDWAEVRPLSEILRTLDFQGRLGGLPFMPEMASFCGRAYPVLRRVRQTCIEGAGMQRFERDDVVLLDGVRCDARAHDSCQKRCMIFWKEGWLRRPGTARGLSWGVETAAQATPNIPAGLLPVRDANGKYLCQSTELERATRPLSIRSRIAGCLGDLRDGNYSMPVFLRGFIVPVWMRLRKMIGSDGHLRGPNQRTPVETTGLQAGDLVEVRSMREIALTLDRNGRNRGLEFTPLMNDYCGRRYQVLQRVERIILEDTGAMRQLQDTVILNGSSCAGWLKLGGCPRESYHLWREIWLRRVNGAVGGSGAPAGAGKCAAHGSGVVEPD